MIAGGVDDARAGHPFGYARAMDHTGAVLGALTAAAILQWGTQRLETVIALSAVPGLLAAILVAVGIHEPVRPVAARTALPPMRWSLLHPAIRHYLLLLSLFAPGRLPETFLLLRGHDLGLGAAHLLVL